MAEHSAYSHSQYIKKTRNHFFPTPFVEGYEHKKIQLFKQALFLRNCILPDKKNLLDSLFYSIYVKLCCVINHCVSLHNEEKDHYEIGTILSNIISLAEHNCDPNCKRKCNSHKLSLIALRDIAAGEYLSISYANINYINIPTAKVRQEMLRQYWGFTCQCKYCFQFDV